MEINSFVVFLFSAGFRNGVSGVLCVMWMKQQVIIMCYDVYMNYVTLTDGTWMLAVRRFVINREWSLIKPIMCCEKPCHTIYYLISLCFLWWPIHWSRAFASYSIPGQWAASNEQIKNWKRDVGAYRIRFNKIIKSLLSFYTSPAGLQPL